MENINYSRVIELMGNTIEDLQKRNTFLEKANCDLHFELSQFSRTILLDALHEIDTHIRAASDPIPYIIRTLKNSLPEYKE